MCISGTGIVRRDKRLKGSWHFDTISGANLASYLILLVSSQLKLAEVVNSLDWDIFMLLDDQNILMHFSEPQTLQVCYLYFSCCLSLHI